MNWKGEMIYPSDVASDSRVELGEIERQRLSESRELLLIAGLSAIYSKRTILERESMQDSSEAIET